MPYLSTTKSPSSGSLCTENRQDLRVPRRTGRQRSPPPSCRPASPRIRFRPRRAPVPRRARAAHRRSAKRELSAAVGPGDPSDECGAGAHRGRDIADVDPWPDFRTVAFAIRLRRARGVLAESVRSESSESPTARQHLAELRAVPHREPACALRPTGSGTAPERYPLSGPRPSPTCPSGLALPRSGHPAARSPCPDRTPSSSAPTGPRPPGARRSAGRPCQLHWHVSQLPCGIVSFMPMGRSAGVLFVQYVRRIFPSRKHPVLRVPTIRGIRRMSGVPPCGPEHAPRRVRITHRPALRGRRTHLAADRSGARSGRQLCVRLHRRRRGHLGGRQQR